MELNNGAFGGGSTGSGGGASQADVELLKSKLTSTVFKVSPADGATVVLQSTVSVISVIEVTPSTDLAKLTIKLPSASIGQRVFVHVTKQIDELSFTFDGKVDNWMMSVSAGDCVDFTKSNDTTWSRNT